MDIAGELGRNDLCHLLQNLSVCLSVLYTVVVIEFIVLCDYAVFCSLLYQTHGNHSQTVVAKNFFCVELSLW